MHKKPCLLNKKIFLPLGTLSSIFIFSIGCAPSGVVLDKEQFETPVERIYLSDDPFIKVCHGGTISKVPLRQIQLIKINPSSSIVFENELYYSAELVFQNGAKMQSSNDKTKSAPIFISVENTLSGKSKDQSFSISLDNVKQIKINK